MSRITKSSISNYKANPLIDNLLFAQFLQEETNARKKEVLGLLSSYPSNTQAENFQIENVKTLIFDSKILTKMLDVEKSNEKLLKLLITEILRKNRFPKHILKGHVISPDVNIIKKQPQDVWIPLFEVHCPPVKGTTATLSQIICRGKSGGLNVNILGTGGKFNSTFKDCISTEVNSNHKGCIIKKRKITIIPYTFEIKCERCDFTTGIKNEVKCIPSEDTLQDFIPKNEDPCRNVKLLNSLKKGRTMTILQSNTDEGIESTNEKVIEFSLGITSPFTFNITGSVSSKQTISFSYHLESPWAYTPYSKKKIPRGWKISPKKN